MGVGCKLIYIAEPAVAGRHLCYMCQKIVGNVVIVAGVAVEERVPLGDRWQWPQKCEVFAGSAHSP